MTEDSIYGTEHANHVPHGYFFASFRVPLSLLVFSLFGSQWRLCEIGLEDYSFVILSRYTFSSVSLDFIKGKIFFGGYCILIRLCFFSN